MADNKNKKRVVSKITYEKRIAVFFLIILSASLIYNIFLQDGNKSSRILLTIGTVILSYAVFRFTFLKKSKMSYLLCTIFIFFSMYLGNVLDFYTYVPHYDKILHLVSGVIIGLIGVIVYVELSKENYKDINLSFLIIFVIVFSLALAGLWELWEFSTDIIFDLESQRNSLFDTMTDMTCGLIGGIIDSLLIYFLIKSKNNHNFIKAMIDEIM